MFTQLRGCWALAVLAACGGSTITGVTGGAPPDNTTDGDRDAGTGGNGITAGDAGAESASDAPSMLGPCDGECTLSFASGADWRAYDDDPASNAGAIFLGSAQPVCLNASAPPNCPANAFNYGLAGSAWGVSLSMIPGALWIWGPNITLYYLADLKRFFFAHKFELGSAPQGRLSIAVDDAAAVRINGTELAAVGSVTDITTALDAQSRLTTFDLTPLLRPGENTITIAVQNGPASYAGCPSACTYMQNPGGVVFGGTLSYR